MFCFRTGFDLIPKRQSLLAFSGKIVHEMVTVYMELKKKARLLMVYCFLALNRLAYPRFSVVFRTIKPLKFN